jgi:hypothetical protein
VSPKSSTVVALPDAPYRGLEPYRFCDQIIFFEREIEAERLVRLVTMYRASLLYGESGTGKSSLINAGFIPRAVAAGMSVERLRVQPRPDFEFVVERMAVSAESADFLPSLLVPESNQQRTALSPHEFLDRIQAAGDRDLVLIFDQFEELLTQTTEEAAAEAVASQRRIIQTIVSLLQDRQKSRVRLLFVFREDYLAKFDRLFYYCPELPDHFLRLTPPPAGALHRMIRGPFESERIPSGHWSHEIPTAVAIALEDQLRPAEEGRGINLSQVQIAVLQLWRSDQPADALARRGVDGLVSDYLEQELRRFRDSRDAIEGLLSLMITREGTRKVIPESEVLESLWREENLRPEKGRAALESLVGRTRLVRRDYNRGTTTYEIVSEFLVPWIRTLKMQRSARQIRSRWLKRAATAVLAIGSVLGGAFYWKFTTTTEAARATELVRAAEQRANAAEVRAERASREAIVAKEEIQRLQDVLNANANERERKVLEALRAKSAEYDQLLARYQAALQQLESIQKNLGQSVEQEKKGRSADLAKAEEQIRQLTTEAKTANDRAAEFEKQLKQLPQTPSRIETPGPSAARKRQFEATIVTNLDDLVQLWPVPVLPPYTDKPYVFVSKAPMRSFLTSKVIGEHFFVAVVVPDYGRPKDFRSAVTRILREFASKLNELPYALHDGPAEASRLKNALSPWGIRQLSMAYGAYAGTKSAFTAGFTPSDVYGTRETIVSGGKGAFVEFDVGSFSSPTGQYELLVNLDVSSPFVLLSSLAEK